MKPATRKKITTTLLVGLAAVAWVFALVLLHSTLVTPWLPFAIGFAFAAMLFPLAWNKVKPSDLSSSGKLWAVWRVAVYLAVAVPMGVILLLAMNKYVAPGETTQIEATVTSKYSREQSDYRTVGRRRVYQGKSMRYYLVATTPSGHTKDYMVSPGVYAGTRKGATITLTTHKGCLGFDVIDHTKMPTTYRKKKSRR